MRRFEWSRVLIVLLVVALLSLGGCGGGGGGDKGGDTSPAPSPSPSPSPAPSPSPTPNPGPTPEPSPAPDPSPTPGGPVDLSSLDGRWRPYDGSGTFTGSNGEVHEMVLESTSFVLFRYIQQPSPHAGEVMVGQALRWKSRTTASKKGFRIGRIPDTPYKGTKGENGTKIVFGDGNTMEIIDPKNPAYFIVHEEGTLYERGFPYRYDRAYRIEKRI